MTFPPHILYLFPPNCTLSRKYHANVSVFYAHWLVLRSGLKELRAINSTDPKRIGKKSPTATGSLLVNSGCFQDVVDHLYHLNVCLVTEMTSLYGSVVDDEEEPVNICARIYTMENIGQELLSASTSKVSLAD